MKLQKTSNTNLPSNELSCLMVGLKETKGIHCEYGDVYTRPEVVNFILDLSGYTIEKPLYEMCILEPSFGMGSFLFEIINRLLTSWKKSGGKNFTDAKIELKNAIRAVEINPTTFQITHNHIVTTLKIKGLSAEDATVLANKWLIQSDFLTHEFDKEFNFVVGNPPYIRQESIDPQRLEEYRTRYQTLYDRADIYVPFIERSLLLLSRDGNVGFICADRWMKNRYGQFLRNFIDKNYFLKVYVDMVGTAAFYSDVTAYPAIVIISREKSDVTRMAYRPNIEKKNLKALSELLVGKSSNNDKRIFETSRITNGTSPWVLSVPEQAKLIRRIESNFLPLEQSGCKVGIGVATGADKVFIGDYDSLDVEYSRKLPLVTTKDIIKGEIDWKGKGVINPFAEDGQLVDLHLYPKLQKYLESNREIVVSRHCVQKKPDNWYRTIDRITPTIASIPKLLIPDIKGYPHVVYENGKLYPHHNLYYVTSSKWDLRALQAVLLSSIAKLFIMNYSTKMRGDYLRFQAQYLRRICIPDWDNVSDIQRKSLVDAANSRDVSACDRIVFELYELNQNERILIKEATSIGA